MADHDDGPDPFAGEVADFRAYTESDGGAGSLPADEPYGTCDECGVPLYADIDPDGWLCWLCASYRDEGGEG